MENYSVLKGHASGFQAGARFLVSMQLSAG